jgi:glycosyltransferase involved in cell wall biosynthesis
LHTWHILTGEYPPDIGGVADHARMVAERLLAAGDRVHVWTRSSGHRHHSTQNDISVHRLGDTLNARTLAILAERLEVARDERLLVEYVPQAFGAKGMNLPLCRWLMGRRQSPIITIFHEVGCAFSFSQPAKYNLQAAMHRVMAMLAVRSSSRVIVTIPRWRELLRPLAARGCKIEVLPVFSNLAVVDDRTAIDAVRKHVMPKGGLLIGHFGSFGSNVTPMLTESVPRLLEHCPQARVLLLGNGGQQYRQTLASGYPSLADRIIAAGTLPADELSVHVGACDLMLQPFPDGISGRRSSAMVGLQHGRAMVSTIGALSEPYWRGTDALLAAPAGDLEAFSACAERVLRDRNLRRALGAAAARMYRERFSLERTVMALRTDPAGRGDDSDLARGLDRSLSGDASGESAVRAPS